MFINFWQGNKNVLDHWSLYVPDSDKKILVYIFCHAHNKPHKLQEIQQFGRYINK